MTAEQILEKNCIAISAGEYAIDCDKAHAAMDLYAQQQAIEFAEYISDHRLDFESSSEKGCWIGLNMKVVSSKDLYAQFLEHQNKQA